MESIQALAPPLLRELLRRGPLSQEKLECAWLVAVGPAIARATTVRLGERGLVEIRAADEAWRRELKRALPELAVRLKSLVGAESVTAVKLDRCTGRPA